MTALNQPHIQIPLSPILEGYCRYVYQTPEKKSHIELTRKHHLGLLIASNVQPVTIEEQQESIIAAGRNPGRCYSKALSKMNLVTFTIPTTAINHYQLTSHHLSIPTWSLQKILDYINADFRSWVLQRFCIGYSLNYDQKDICYAILRGLDIRSNSYHFDMIKKMDYRNRRRVEYKRFESLLFYEKNS